MDFDPHGNARLVAIYPIRENEELLVSYTLYDVLLQEYETRQKKFEELWEFRCRCIICKQYETVEGQDLEQSKRSRAWELVTELHIADFRPLSTLNLRDDDIQITKTARD